MYNETVFHTFTTCANTATISLRTLHHPSQRPLIIQTLPSPIRPSPPPPSALGRPLSVSRAACSRHSNKWTHPIWVQYESAPPLCSVHLSQTSRSQCLIVYEPSNISLGLLPVLPASTPPSPTSQTPFQSEFSNVSMVISLPCVSEIVKVLLLLLVHF